MFLSSLWHIGVQSVKHKPDYPGKHAFQISQLIKESHFWESALEVFEVLSFYILLRWGCLQKYKTALALIQQQEYLTLYPWEVTLIFLISKSLTKVVTPPDSLLSCKVAVISAKKWSLNWQKHELYSGAELGKYFRIIITQFSSIQSNEWERFKSFCHYLSIQHSFQSVGGPPFFIYGNIWMGSKYTAIFSF